MIHESAKARIIEDFRACVADMISVDELLAVCDFRAQIESKV